MSKKIGKLFRELRKDKGLSLVQASDNILSPSQLSHFERGDGDITTDRFFALIQNIDISIAEFSSFLKKDETTTLFEVVGNLEQHGALDKLNTLYEKERRKNRNSVKKQDYLNLIALKCVLIHYGQKDRLTIIEQEILEDYLQNVTDWKISNLQFLAVAVTQLDNQSIIFYLDSVLDQESLDINLLLMVLRNSIYVLINNSQYKKATYYLETFKSLIPKIGTIEIGITYMLLEANLYEKLDNFQTTISILVRVSETYEQFFLSEKAKIYRDEIKRLQQKL